METRKTALVIGLIVGILTIGIVSGWLILGRSKVVNLKTNPISSAVEDGLSSSSEDSYRPIEGKDYTIISTREFEDGNWVVVSVGSADDSFDSAILVLKKSGGSYETVLGPGTSFTDAELDPLPDDVANFIGG